MTPPFRVEARIKNNRLIKARVEAGYATIASAARAIGISNTTLCGFETLRESPRDAKGDWTVQAKRIASFYGFGPSYLWPAVLDGVKKPVVSLEVSECQVAGILSANAPRSPLALLASKDADQALSVAMGTLQPRERDVLMRRMGDAPPTYDQIAGEMGLSRTRIQQMEWGAIRKLREHFDHHPEQAEAALDALRMGALEA